MSEFIEVDGACAAQFMVPMRDGTRLNTFVYLPRSTQPSFPVILHRTPYSITAAGTPDPTDCSRGWLPDPAEPLRGSILRGWKMIVARGYAAVYQDTRGRFGSEGEDLVYGADANDGADTLEWIAAQPWCNQHVGLSGSSAGATTALAAAASGHPCARAFFAQAGGASIYDDVVYEGQSIQMERLWLWVAKNLPGMSRSHRAIAAERAGISLERLEEISAQALACYERLDEARMAEPPFVASDDWLRLPLIGHPSFSVCQPYLNEILSHPAPDAFRARHDFRRDIRIPGFHVTSWYDIFLTSMVKTFQALNERVGNQRLWIGPNGHYFVYQEAFWPRDPYFEWFDYWLKDHKTPIVDEPRVHYSPRAWTPTNDTSHRSSWRYAQSWPPHDVEVQTLTLGSDGRLRPSADGAGEGAARSFHYDPRAPIATRGGRNMLIEPGQLDQRPNEAHADYGLMYTSEPLASDFELLGSAHLELHVESDCPDTDFVARLVEVFSDGTACLLMDGITRAMLREPARGAQRLSPGKIVAIDIALGDICHTVRAGHRLRVDINSSNFPRHARNTNSGNLLLAADSNADIRIATNTVHHGADTPARLRLSVALTQYPGKLSVGLRRS